MDTDQTAGQTDWERIRTMTDEEIQRGIDSDPDAALALSDEEMRLSYKPHPARMKR